MFSLSKDYVENTDMGKYAALLDAGVRIMGRFQAHCPQTAHMYYKPPASNGNSNKNDKKCNGGNGTRSGVTLRTVLMLLKKVDLIHKQHQVS